MIADWLAVSPEVAAALAAGQAGRRARIDADQPRVALSPEPGGRDCPEAAVRAAGAVPATVAIHDGRLLVGLDDGGLETLATARAGSVRKAARPILAAAIADGGWAATTVSATMIAAHAAGIAVFATGGIGGVHRGALGGSRRAHATAAPTFDISSDLEELGRTPMAVVCAGPKAILDVPATLEYLETRGVPVVAVGQADLPGFFARSAGIAGAGVGRRCRGAADARGDPSRPRARGGDPGLRSRAGRRRAPDDVAREAVERAIGDAAAAGIGGTSADALAAGPDRGPDGRRVDARQHGADRQQRARRGRARGRLAGG